LVDVKNTRKKKDFDKIKKKKDLILDIFTLRVCLKQFHVFDVLLNARVYVFKVHICWCFLLTDFWDSQE
jgi:endonuclease IV